MNMKSRRNQSSSGEPSLNSQKRECMKMKNMFSLKDKIAVISGGGSGIGLASARRFVEAGATVIIACRSDSTEIAESFGASWIGTDVSNPD